MGQSAAQYGPESVAAQTLREALAPLGLFEARADELGPARALAARMIHPDIAGEAALRALHGKTGYGIYIAHEDGEVGGVLALLMLNRAGHAAVERETFDALNPALEHIADANEEPAAVYGWGVVGATREAARTIVRGCRASLDALSVPFFARAATEAGLRMLTQRLAFTPYPGSATGLLWHEPRIVERRAA